MRIEEMSIDQLMELNEVICERIDYLRAVEDQEMRRRLCLGNQVHFEGRMGQQVFGVVIKINRKTVIVQSQNGKQYKIPPSMLSLVTDIEEI